MTDSDASEDPQEALTVEHDKIGLGWHVRVNPTITVGMFSSEAEAQAWIDEQSKHWLQRRAAAERFA
jgi:hypothetical protein